MGVSELTWVTRAVARQLRTGVLSRTLWPMQAAQPEGCVCENGSVAQSEAALLWLRLPQMPATIYHPETRETAAPQHAGDAAPAGSSQPTHAPGGLVRQTYILAGQG